MFVWKKLGEAVPVDPKIWRKRRLGAITQEFAIIFEAN